MKYCFQSWLVESVDVKLADTKGLNEKSPHVSRPKQFNQTLFNGQLYMQSSSG